MLDCPEHIHTSPTRTLFSVDFPGHLPSAYRAARFERFQAGHPLAIRARLRGDGLLADRHLDGLRPVWSSPRQEAERSRCKTMLLLNSGLRNGILAGAHRRHGRRGRQQCGRECRGSGNRRNARRQQQPQRGRKNWFIMDHSFALRLILADLLKSVLAALLFASGRETPSYIKQRTILLTHIIC